jgi:hypothetical protein
VKAIAHTSVGKNKRNSHKNTVSIGNLGRSMGKLKSGLLQYF